MRKIIPIDKFFQEMDLSDDEKKRREDLAQDLYILFSLYFAEIVAERMGNHEIDVAYYKDMLYRQYCDKVEVYLVLLFALLGRKTISDTMKEDIRQRVSDIVDTTMKFDDEFYTSSDRATLLACNEANFVGNTTDYDIAKYQGYRHKQWLTMADEKVRATHTAVEGKTIGIDEYFQVGLAEMLYPMDMSRNGAEHPEETASCRCVCVYLR